MLSTSGTSSSNLSITPPTGEDRQGAYPPAVSRATRLTVMRYRSLHGSGLGVPECTDFGALTDHLCRRWPPGRRGPIEGPEPLLRDTTRSSALARCQSGEDLLVDQSVGGHGVAAERAVLSLEGREAAARLRDDRDQRDHVVQRELRFAGGVHRALGHQHVRPEVAIGAGAPEALHQVQHLRQTLRLRPAAQGRVRQRRLPAPGGPGDPQSTGGVDGGTGPGADPGPAPPAARQDGADTSPMTGWPSSIRPIRVAQTGTPRTKLRVPSIGSITHWRAEEPGVPNSSPITWSRDRERASWERTSCSAA